MNTIIIIVILMSGLYAIRFLMMVYNAIDDYTNALHTAQMEHNEMIERYEGRR